MGTLLAIITLLPLAAGFVFVFLPSKMNGYLKLSALAISALAFGLSIYIFAIDSVEYSLTVLRAGSLHLDLLLTSTSLGSFMLLFAMGFGLLITIYSLKSVTDITRINEYYGAILLTIGGSAGILLANHLLVLLVFWEIVTAALYLLISTGSNDARFAATKSFAMIGASDGSFLLGIAILWTTTGTFIIGDINLATTSAAPIAAFVLLMVAAITKAGAMPLHTWLPTSGEHAPVSVMALLPAAIDKLLGIYLLVLITREIFLLHSATLSIILAIIGAATILVAVMIAMVQHNLKKLLSYHAISQVGYMVLGIATMTPIGIAGGVFHMLNHAIYKCCLFLGGGAVEQATGTAELDKLGGLAKKMPVTFITSLIAALSISGIPPFNGFVSKWMVYQGVVDMGTNQTTMVARLWPIWLVAAMFGSALTLASFVKLIHSVFLSRLPSRLSKVKEAFLSQTIPMSILAFLCILFGVFYRLPLKLFIYPALGIKSDIAMLGIWHSGIATTLILIGVGLGLLILLLGRFTKQVRLVPTWSCGETQTNKQMTIPGTHFYKTVSSLPGLRQLYDIQEKGFFDPYNQSSKVGLAFTSILRSLHSGLLPMYITWVTLGLVGILFVVCKIW